MTFELLFALIISDVVFMLIVLPLILLLKTFLVWIVQEEEKEK